MIVFQRSQSVLKLMLAMLALILSASQISSASAADADKKLKVQFIASEPCSLLEFVGTIAGRPHTTEWLRAWYWQKRRSEDQPADRALLGRVYKMFEANENKYEFSMVGRELDLYQKLMVTAAGSTTVEDFLIKSKAFLQGNDYATMEEACHRFAPVYHDLVWQPCLPLLRKQVAEYADGAAGCLMADRLAAVKSFMRAPWQDGLPFTVVLIPLPGNGGHSHGESMGPLQIVELKPGATFRKDADVVFHEACHALWFSIKDRAGDKLFVGTDGRALPITELYEGMATALGQGCFAMEAFGRTPPSWYADRTIEAYSRKVAPLYSEYLGHDKLIDAEFGRRATDIYYQNFGDVDSLVAMTSDFVITAEDVPDLAAFKAEVQRLLPRLRQLSISAPIESREASAVWNKYDGRHAAFLLSKKDLDKLVTLVELSAAQMAILKAAESPVTLMVKGREIVVCLGPDTAAQQKQMFNILRSKRWPQAISDAARQPDTIQSRSAR